jgi:glycosyltransferase involved in cell wall biosynthesis
LQGTCTQCIRRHPLLPERWGAAAGDPPDTEVLYAQAVRERFEKHKADLREADQVLSPSHFLADVFAKAGFFAKDDCEVLKAGYPGPLHPARSHVRKGAFRVGYVGGIYPSKGVHVLVRAFQQLTHVHAELHIFGHLDWFPEYVEELERDAGEGPVFFHGHFEPGEIDEILGDVDCLVLPSVWYENMPITVHEAYRNGLPVIATDLGGMRECVQNEVSGLLFPREDETALAHAIRRLAEEPGLYARLSHGRLEVPTLGQVVDRLEELYRG